MKLDSVEVDLRLAGVITPISPTCSPQRVITIWGVESHPFLCLWEVVWDRGSYPVGTYRHWNSGLRSFTHLAIVTTDSWETSQLQLLTWPPRFRMRNDFGTHGSKGCPVKSKTTSGSLMLGCRDDSAGTAPLVTETDYLSSGSEAHVIKGENQLVKVVPSPPHAQHTHVQTHRQHAQKFLNKNFHLMWIPVLGSHPRIRVPPDGGERVMTFGSSYDLSSWPIYQGTTHLCGMCVCACL